MPTKAELIRKFNYLEERLQEIEDHLKNGTPIAKPTDTDWTLILIFSACAACLIVVAVYGLTLG